MSKEYLEALEKFLDDYLTLCEKLHTNRQEKMLLDKNSPYNVLKTYLESIDNAKPSEALKKLNLLLDRANHDEILLRKSIDFCEKWLKEIQEAYDTIKQALLKAQEPKKYLKWEDLEFKEEEQTMKVKLNNKIYTMFYCSDEVCFDTVSIAGVFIDSCSQQFFNDLHLERVEE